MKGPAGEKWRTVSALSFSADERATLDRIEDCSRRLRSDDRIIERVDFGSGPSGSGVVSVARLARRASVSPSWGRLLFKLARTHAATSILELGTCIGISSAYLQGALDLNGSGRLTTVEGDPALCRIAERTLSQVSSAAGQVVSGRFMDVLPELLRARGPFDFVFIDGHHNPEAVEAYYQMIEPHLMRNALLVVDDIQPVNGAVRPAWGELTRKRHVEWFVNLIRMGILGHAAAQ